MVATGLDYESNASLPLAILGREGNRTLVKQFTVTVLDVNESLPVVEPAPFDFNASVLTVYEDAGVGTEIGHVYRVSGDLNNTVEFSLELDGYESSFSVDNNGSIMVATLDYESNASLPLAILGREGNRTLVKQFTVTVLDVNESTLPVVEPAPFDFNASVLTVYEDAGVGTEIGHVYRVSGDLNNTVEFSLELDGYESSFSVDNNGSIMVATGLDYESNASLPLNDIGKGRKPNLG